MNQSVKRTTIKLNKSVVKVNRHWNIKKLQFESKDNLVIQHCLSVTFRPAAAYTSWELEHISSTYIELHWQHKKLLIRRKSVHKKQENSSSCG